MRLGHQSPWIQDVPEAVHIYGGTKGHSPLLLMRGEYDALLTWTFRHADSNTDVSYQEV